MKVLENIYYDSKLYRMVFIDRNGNEFNLVYINGNIEISIENDSVVIDDVLEAHEVFKERQNEKNS